MKTKYKRNITVEAISLLQSLKNFPLLIKTKYYWKKVSFQNLHGKPLQIIKCLSKHPYYIITLPTFSCKRKNKFYISYER